MKECGSIDAGGLSIGDPLIDVHGNVLVVENTRMEYLDEQETVYNFQVEDFHTYYVGANCIFVHNAGDLYRRSGFRKSTNAKAVREAPRNERVNNMKAREYNVQSVIKDINLKE